MPIAARTTHFAVAAGLLWALAGPTLAADDVKTSPAANFTPIPKPADVDREDVAEPSARTLAHPCHGITDEAARLACFHKICGL